MRRVALISKCMVGLLLLWSASACDSVNESACPSGSAQCEEGAPVLAQQGGGDIPCNVATVLGKHCAECHGARTAFGAPMSLTTAADFKKASPSGKTYAEVVPTRLETTNTNIRMPPLGKPALTAAEIATVKTWMGSGALSATNG